MAWKEHFKHDASSLQFFFLTLPFFLFLVFIEENNGFFSNSESVSLQPANAKVIYEHIPKHILYIQLIYITLFIFLFIY